MSATILNPKAFCRSVGLKYDKEVKFIHYIFAEDYLISYIIWANFHVIPVGFML